jgi:phospholipid transport system substrate-binding protein
MRTAAITIIQALTWLTIASGFVVAPAEGAEPPAVAAPPPGPQELMSDLSARLFAALDKEPAAARHNPNKILPLVDRLLSPNFDMEYTGRLVLGLHWRSATPAQRQHFAVALFQRLIRTYAGAVADWTQDRFKVLPLRADPEALQVTVRTQVTSERGAIVPVDFRMRQTAEGWKIFDVTVDGVSYARIYHDDTDQEITQKGIDASIARLSKSDPGALKRMQPPNPRGAR